MSFLHHSFSVRGRIEQCWLFVYRTPVPAVRELLPPPLEPVTHGGFAFWNIVVCRLRSMRPAPMPGWCGLGYWHIAYRLHARVATSGLDGLYFVRSDCDSPLVTFAGNRLTDFRFHLARVAVEISDSTVIGRVETPAGDAQFHIGRGTTPHLAEGSPFPTLAAAASALEYPPRALCPRGRDRVTVVNVHRDPAAWRWRTVGVGAARWEPLARRETVLELCYEVDPIDYLWERGRHVPVRLCES